MPERQQENSLLSHMSHEGPLQNAQTTAGQRIRHTGQQLVQQLTYLPSAISSLSLGSILVEAWRFFEEPLITTQGYY